MISFDAGSESIRTPAAFAELSTATICFWLRPNSVSGANRIMGTDTLWECRLTGSDMLHEFRQSAQPNMTTVFAVGVEYHVAFVFDGTNKGAYVNGAADPAPAPLAHGTPGTDTVLHVGTSGTNVAEGANCEMEDLRMYNRVLSQAEIQQIYNGNGRDSIWNGLQHWWTLNNGPEGTTVASEPDLVNNVNLTTIVGTPTYIKSPRTFITQNY